MRFGEVASAKGAAVPVSFGLVGWALCGAAMGVGMKLTSLETALVVHAMAAPVIFGGLSYVYFRSLESWPPLRTAVVFLGVVAAMDVVVVALLIERSFEMFESLLGTWLPFFLIFSCTWLMGFLVRRPSG